MYATMERERGFDEYFCAQATVAIIFFSLRVRARKTLLKRRSFSKLLKAMGGLPALLSLSGYITGWLGFTREKKVPEPKVFVTRHGPSARAWQVRWDLE